MTTRCFTLSGWSMASLMAAWPPMELPIMSTLLMPRASRKSPRTPAVKVIHSFSITGLSDLPHPGMSIISTRCSAARS